jgi:hypothetical protein
MVGADGFSGFWFIYGPDLSVVNFFFWPPLSASCLPAGHCTWTGQTVRKFISGGTMIDAL